MGSVFRVGDVELMEFNPALPNLPQEILEDLDRELFTGQRRYPTLCGLTSIPEPRRNSAGPIWSKKMNGPTICLCVEGSARRTEKPPRSRARGTMTISMASQVNASPGLGSMARCQLMLNSQLGCRMLKPTPASPPREYLSIYRLRHCRLLAHRGQSATS
jgi:hypothetical protein